MHNKVYGRKFSRNTNSRKALFRGLMKELFERGSMTTTEAKVKAIIGDVDGIMRKISKATLSDYRAVASELAMDREAVQKLFTNMKELANARQSGYTTFYALPPRRGDRAKLAKISFVQSATAAAVEEKAESKEPAKRSPRGKRQEVSK